MSDTQQQKGQAKQKPRKGGGGNGGLKLGMLAMVLLVIGVSLPTLILASIALVPAFVAFVAEKGRHRYAWIAVAALGLAGAAPDMIELWFDSGFDNLKFATEKVQEIFFLVKTFLGSAIGWGIYLAMPHIVGNYLAMTAGQRANALRQEQKVLIQKWGKGVSSK
jgi:hypothetical protein